jgi:hypothetical protein
MSDKFFELTFDASGVDYWQFEAPKYDDGSDVSVWAFSACRPFQPSKKLVTSVMNKGAHAPLVFGTFGTLFAERPLAGRLSELAGERIQVLPVDVRTVATPFSIVNVLDEVDCVDESRSEFTKWEPGNEARPDKAGQYQSFTRLTIDPARAKGHDLFRLKGWHMALIVSSATKRAIEEYGAAGSQFRPV